MTFLKKVITAAAILGFFVSCGSDKEETPVAAPQVQAVKKEGSDNAHDIILSQDWFEVPHMLSVAVISGAPSPTGSALANKIVTFKKTNDTVLMFESLKGRLISDSVETEDFMLAFPILETTDAGVKIDFEKGLNLIFQKRRLRSFRLYGVNECELIKVSFW